MKTRFLIAALALLAGVPALTIGVATNNEAEYGGLIAGLARALALGVQHLAVHGDAWEIECEVRQVEEH